MIPYCAKEYAFWRMISSGVLPLSRFDKVGTNQNAGSNCHAQDPEKRADSLRVC